MIGLDLLEVAPVAGAEVLQGDVFDPATPARLRAAAGGRAAVVLSDMAAPSTGQRAVDRLRAEAIGEAVLALLPDLLAPGGSAVIKLVRGAESGVSAAARRVFERVQLVRPEATHRGSSEIYLVAIGYRGAAREFGLIGKAGSDRLAQTGRRAASWNASLRWRPSEPHRREMSTRRQARA